MSMKRRHHQCAKQIGEGNVPVAELKAFGLWPIWVDCVNASLRRYPDPDHPVLGLKFRLFALELFIQREP